MNQEMWKIRLEKVFEGTDYEVVPNPKEKNRNIYVCKSGKSKRLISVWSNRDLYNLVLQREVKEALETLEIAGFELENYTKLSENLLNYEKLSDYVIINICKAYVESIK